MKTTMARQHDAHVRARARLIGRIVARRREFGMNYEMKGATDSQLRAAAGNALARYAWPEWWPERQLGRYSPFGGYDGPVVMYRDVPSTVIQSIMCRMAL